MNFYIKENIYIKLDNNIIWIIKIILINNIGNNSILN